MIKVDIGIAKADIGSEKWTFKDNVMTKTEICVKEYFEKGILGNVAIRVGKSQQVLFELYQSESGTVDKDTLFDMASVTKIVVTASLALIALDRGLISLEDRVAKYFDCPKDKSSLTVEHLLTHRIGIGHKDLRQPGQCFSETGCNTSWIT